MIQKVIKIIKELDFSKEFVIDNITNRNFTYNEFFGMALHEAEFIEKTVLSNDVIAVKENSLELALLFFAVMFTSKRILVVDPQKGKEEVICILDEIKSTGIILDEKLDLKGYSRHYRMVMPLLEGKHFVEKDGVKQEVIHKLEMRGIRMPYLVTFTSGTSGVTKGVEHTLDNLFLTAFALDEKVKKKGGTFIHVMPMTYMAGILNSLIYPFLIGARIVIDKRFSIISARYFWNTVIKYEADLFWLSPSMLMIIDQMDRKDIGEEYCRNHEMTFLIGTAPLTNEMRTKFNKRYNVDVYASYGLSETLFISVETKESLKKSDKNSVGELLSGVEYVFTDADEMYIKVPWMYLGYTNENTKNYFAGEYYKSGDLAKIKEGCLYIIGRSKELIIKGGMNISPILIENAVYKNKNILETVVIGVKDANNEEKVCCVYQLKNHIDNKIDFEAGLKKMVICELGNNYAIDYLWNVETIPRNINGKIDKNKLKKEWMEK